MNKDNRTVNVGKNAFSAFSNKIIILILTFISRKIFIQYIGVNYLGINGLFSNVLTLLSLADLGLGTAMNVSLYKPIAENDTKKIGSLLNYYKIIYYYIAAGVLGIGLLLIPFLKYIVNMDQEIPYLYIYYIIFLVQSAVSYLFVYKSSIIRADQKTYLINKLDIFVNISKVVIQIITTIIFKNYFVYIIISVLAVIANNLVISYVADKNYSFINQHNVLDKEEKKSVFSNVSSIFLYKIAWTLLNGTDNILISMICGTVFVGLYSNYCTITYQLETFIALLFSSLTASIGNLVATANFEKRYQTFKTMQMVSFWICGIVTVCLFYLTQDFIELWLGKELLLDNLTLIAIVLNVFFSTCMRPVWTFREGTGMYKQIRYIMFLTAVLNLILSVILGKWLGISGILFATSISKIATYFWYEPNVLFKSFFKTKPLLYYIEYLKNAGLIIASVVLCYIPIKYLSQNVSIVNWLIKAVICVIIVNVIYYLRYRNKNEFSDIKNRVCSLIGRKRKKVD